VAIRYVAQVVSADLDRVGLLRPGDAPRFRRASLAEARLLDQQNREALQRRLGPITAHSRDLFEPEYRAEGPPG
jgi:allophanate hydrolase subunit 2